MIQNGYNTAAQSCREKEETVKVQEWADKGRQRVGNWERFLEFAKQLELRLTMIDLFFIFDLKLKSW